MGRRRRNSSSGTDHFSVAYVLRGDYWLSREWHLVDCHCHFSSCQTPSQHIRSMLPGPHSSLRESQSFLHFICSSQTTGHRCSLPDLPARLSSLLLQPQFPFQSTSFQPHPMAFCFAVSKLPSLVCSSS